MIPAAGSDFVRGHLESHRPPDRQRVVLGYCFGYRLPGDASFMDLRHEIFTRARFDLGAFAAPWCLFWTMNCSVEAEAFWLVGGFDESFRGWGGENLELGYRLFRARPCSRKYKNSNGAAFQVHKCLWLIKSTGWFGGETVSTPNGFPTRLGYSAPSKGLGTTFKTSKENAVMKFYFKHDGYACGTDKDASNVGIVVMRGSKSDSSIMT